MTKRNPQKQKNTQLNSADKQITKANTLRLILTAIVTLAVLLFYRLMLITPYFHIVFIAYLVLATAAILGYVIYNRGFSRKGLTAEMLPDEWSEDKKIENVIQEGYKHIGVPYVYGAVRLHDGNGKLLSGFTAQKFDCSSLVQYVFYKGADTLLQVTTRTQFQQGKYVSPNDLQRGDCIYFTNEDRQYKTGVERVGHVAIYLGNNYILHTASDYARIEKMSAYRWNFYIEARRFV